MATLLAILAMAFPQAEEKPKVEVTRVCSIECKRRTVSPYRWKLERMARCESGGRWFIATGNGYYGGLQFDVRTWRSVGGWGMPHRNSKLEQMYRAVLLIKQRGYSPWPNCGYV